MWWNKPIAHDRQTLSGGLRTTRRGFLTGLAGAPLVCSKERNANRISTASADIKLSIERTKIEVAPGHTITTSTYNGTAPGPPIRLKEGVPASVHIVNRTEIAEFVHWHGFEIPPDLDGTEEEGSRAIPPGGELRYEMTPLLAGSRYVHSHAMTMGDLSRGVYSGQFAFVYVEPKRNRGRYDQEIFLATHEWEPRLEPEPVEESAEDGEDDEERGSMEVRYGIRSINGKALDCGDPIQVKEGQRVLFHFLNASATENVSLHLPGHTFYVVALDGNPVPRPGRVSVLELGVGERVDALVDMNHPGVWILGSVADDVRKGGLGVRLEYAARRGDPQTAAPGGIPFDYLRFGQNRGHATPDEVIPMKFLRVAPDESGMERWSINGQVYGDHDKPRVLQRGLRYRLALNNRTAEAHPVHLHRYTFELVRVGSRTTSGIRKDVITLQPYQTAEVDFVPQEPGLALFHCHQQMHMEMGFKLLFRVV